MQDARVNLKSSKAPRRPDRPRRSLRARGPGATSAIVRSIATMRQTMPAYRNQICRSDRRSGSGRQQRRSLTGPALGARSEISCADFVRARRPLTDSPPPTSTTSSCSATAPAAMAWMLRIEQQIGNRAIFQSETLPGSIRRPNREERRPYGADARAVAPAIDPARLITHGDAIVHLLASAGQAANAGEFQRDGEGRRPLADRRDERFRRQVITAREVLFPLAPGMLVPAGRRRSLPVRTTITPSSML